MICVWKYALRVNFGAVGLRQDGLGHQHCLCEYDDAGDGDDYDDDGGGGGVERDLQIWMTLAVNMCSL